MRLRTWDYRSPGFYFVTACTAARRPLFGEVALGRMHMTPVGAIARDALSRLDGRDGRIECAVVMPDHVHLLLAITKARGRSLSLFVRDYKALVTHGCRAAGLVGVDVAVWQRGFHDRVIRNDQELDALRRYIETNPLRWSLARASGGAST
ncbi:transposase [Luteitalea sp. TBR-22]|nr:transposase [Luteitalea sp. TBR-22]